MFILWSLVLALNIWSGVFSLLEGASASLTALNFATAGYFLVMAIHEAIKDAHKQ